MSLNENLILNALNQLKITNICLFPFSEMVTPTILIERGKKGDETVDCGKGKDVKSAFLSALFESFERYSAEVYNKYEYIGSSIELGEKYNLCSPTLLYPNNPNSEKADSMSIKWSKGYDLLNRKTCYLPMECIAFPSESSFCNVSTIGLASGQSKIDAILHGIYETIEHDTLTTHVMTKSLGKRLKVKDKFVKNLLIELQSKDIEIEIRYLENIYEVPCVIALMKKAPHFEKYNIAGMGANLDLNIAVIRAVTECQQSYDFWYRRFLSGNLLEKGIIHPPLELKGEFYLNNECNDKKDIKCKFHSLADELNFLISRIGEFTSEIICTDITNDSLKIPCVKITIPDFLETETKIFQKSKGILLEKVLKSKDWMTYEK